ncbi:unnamed protein product [Pedinophyceae sp. YPF-701]|nr:unnamed protein product [Pedinophyceae sp. YPF-701]
MGRGAKAPSSEQAYSRAMALLDAAPRLPSLAVFDLDYTIWPTFCEFHSGREECSVYPEVQGILEALKAKGVKLAVASRSPTASVARAWLKKIDFERYFCSTHIFSSSTNKTEHFQKIKSDTGVPYSEMIFFDDEDRNIHAINRIGVVAVDVSRRGTDVAALKEALDRYGDKADESRGF